MQYYNLVRFQAGCSSQESLRRHFRRIVATSPGAYRQRFCHAEMVAKK